MVGREKKKKFKIKKGFALIGPYLASMKPLPKTKKSLNHQTQITTQSPTNNNLRIHQNYRMRIHTVKTPTQELTEAEKAERLQAIANILSHPDRLGLWASNKGLSWDEARQVLIRAMSYEKTPDEVLAEMKSQRTPSSGSSRR